MGNGTALTSLADTAATIAVNGGTVKTNGNQTYTGAVTLGAGTTLNSNASGSSNGNVTFAGAGTVDGAETLTLTSGTGTDTFGGAVGNGTALTSLADTAATIAVNGGTVKTNGNQTYTGAVTLALAPRLTAMRAAAVTATSPLPEPAPSMAHRR